MKKLLLILILSILFIPNNIFASEKDLEYPRYFGSQFCSTEEVLQKRFPTGIDENIYILYGNIYVNDEVYDFGVESSILINTGEKIIYSKRNGTNVDIYENRKIIASSNGSLVPGWEYNYYDHFSKKYVLDIYDSENKYILSNGEIHDYDNFEHTKVYFSENNKYFLETKNTLKDFKIVKEDKIIFEKDNAKLGDLIVSNNGENYFLGFEDGNEVHTEIYAHEGMEFINEIKKRVFVKNGKVLKNKGEIIEYEFSPNGEDLYFVEKLKTGEINLYKNDEIIFKFYEENNLSVASIFFIDDNNYRLILSDYWNDFVLINNGKIQIGIGENEIIKGMRKFSDNLFILKRDKNLGKDFLYKNDKLFLEAPYISHDFLMNRKYFLANIYSANISNNSERINTYIKGENDETIGIIQNNFYIPFKFDYVEGWNTEKRFILRKIDGGSLYCENILSKNPEIKYSRKTLENAIWKMWNLEENQKNNLKKTLENLQKRNLNNSQKDLVKMLLDNLENEDLQRKIMN